MKKDCSHLIVIAFLTLICSSTAEKIMCKDDRGHPVDWYIAYKLPKMNDSDGSRMAYMDNQSTNWRPLDSPVSASQNPLAYTLDSIYNREDEGSMYAMYNDQVPSNGLDSKPHLDIGHTKGVINFDQESGFWMIHSVPKFPSNKKSGQYYYPHNGFKYGQIFLCFSLSYKFLDNIGDLLLFNNPQFYDFVLPQKFNGSNPNLTAVLEGKHLEKKDLLVRQLTSLGGQKFIGFAKSANYSKDLWEGIAYSLKSSLAVESWRNNGSNMPSLCKSKYTVENVQGINLLGHRFKTTRDHSKWAVSMRGKTRAMNKDVIVFKQKESTNWSCVGDINRQWAQKVRGGGAVCFDHPLAAVNFQNIQDDMEHCPKFT